MRRVLHGLVPAVVLLLSSGCSWWQLFLSDVDVEVDFAPKVWTEFYCGRLPSSALEMMAGEQIYSGRLSLGDSARQRLPRKVRVRARASAANGELLWEAVHLARIDRKTGEFREIVFQADPVVFPAGTEVCWSAKFFKPGFDGRVVWLDSSLVPSAFNRGR